MKNFYSLLLVSLVSLGMFAQSYYVLPALGAGMNPGGLNQDSEFPVGGGLDPSWTVLMAGTTTDQWSASQTLPFSFMFDGQAVTNYVVSNNGVLTFAATPGTAPTATPASLPSGLIPEKSIMIWGVNISGVGSDNIVTKTFGTAPNRQHWIQFSSGSGNGLPANGWSYWSIVLEETTNKMYVVDHRTANGNVAITVGIQVSTTNYTMMNGSPNVSSQSVNDPTPADNSYYEFIMGTPPNGDVNAIEANVTAVVAPNAPVTIEGIFRNMGVTPVSTADFNYTVNGGTKVTDPVNTTISSGEFKSVSSPSAWTPTTDGVYAIEMWLSNINGSADPNPANDKVTAKVIVTSNPPSRRVLIEERTGTWCPWCPRGFLAMEYMGLNNYDNTVLVAVHNGDPMTVNNYDPNLSGGFPTFTADRILTAQSIATGQNMEGAMNNRMAVIPVASLEITNVAYTPGSSSVKVDVKSKFITEETGADYRYQLIFMEDGVTGTGGQWNQANNYAGGGNGPLIDAKGFDWSTAPSSVPNVVYHHVARSLEPSWEGAAGSVPATIAVNQEVTYSFNTTLPSDVVNPNHVKAVVLLLNNNNGGEVVNAQQKKLTNVVSIDEEEVIKANIYPNPARDFFNIELEENMDFSIELINSVGQTVVARNFVDASNATISTEGLAKGVYFINLKAGEQSSSMRIVITE